MRGRLVRLVLKRALVKVTMPPKPRGRARKWVVRWKYATTAKALRPGIWELKEGGYFLRTRVLDPQTGKMLEYSASCAM